MTEAAVVHGVLLAVSGSGVLITGSSGAGKSELALELIARGHALVADDAPELQPDVDHRLIGRSGAMLRDLLEVRGLGVLDIRRLYGPAAVRESIPVDLIVRLSDRAPGDLTAEQRLHGLFATETLLGHEVPTLELRLAPGRNSAVLLETAVRQLRARAAGHDTIAELDARQRQIRGDTR